MRVERRIWNCFLENPQAIEQLIELCAQSQMIAEQVARYPIHTR